VPSDKARAVVDAMERDMGTTLATKQDLDQVSLATRKDLEQVILSTRNDLDQAILSTRNDLEQAILSTRKDLELLRSDMGGHFTLLEQKFESGMSQLELRMTVKMGSMLMLGFGLAIAALRLWA
jgi:hypothetical protein